MKIEFDDNNYVLCEGIRLPLTRENIMDCQINGYDPTNLIEDFYKKSTAYIRDQKINKLLNN